MTQRPIVYGGLALAILAVSSSALLVRWADADPVALAFWRTAVGALVLAGPARRGAVFPRGRQRPLLLVAGAALALHFATWLASLELTSVTASVTLVSIAPLLIAAFLTATGVKPARGTWAAIGLALVGTMIITAGDVFNGGGIETDRTALAGDGLALVGAAAMAVYLVVGDRLRSEMTTATYAARVYALAAVSLVPVLAIGRIPVWGYDRATWFAIGAMVLGPQLAGHTVLNLLLKPLGSLAVGLALLAEPVGATLLALLFLGEIPPPAALVGAPIVLGGLGLHLFGQPARSEAQAAGG